MNILSLPFAVKLAWCTENGLINAVSQTVSLCAMTPTMSGMTF